MENNGKFFIRKYVEAVQEKEPGKCLPFSQVRNSSQANVASTSRLSGPSSLCGQNVEDAEPPRQLEPEVPEGDESDLEFQTARALVGLRRAFNRGVFEANEIEAAKLQVSNGTDAGPETATARPSLLCPSSRHSTAQRRRRRSYIAVFESENSEGSDSRAEPATALGTENSERNNTKAEPATARPSLLRPSSRRSTAQRLRRRSYKAVLESESSEGSDNGAEPATARPSLLRPSSRRSTALRRCRRSSKSTFESENSEGNDTGAEPATAQIASRLRLSSRCNTAQRRRRSSDAEISEGNDTAAEPVTARPILLRRSSRRSTAQRPRRRSSEAETGTSTQQPKMIYKKKRKYRSLKEIGNLEDPAGPIEQYHVPSDSVSADDDDDSDADYSDGVKLSSSITKRKQAEVTSGRRYSLRKRAKVGGPEPLDSESTESEPSVAVRRSLRNKSVGYGLEPHGSGPTVSEPQVAEVGATPLQRKNRKLRRLDQLGSGGVLEEPCPMNINPADFGTPGPKNEFMISY